MKTKYTFLTITRAVPDGEKYNFHKILHVWKYKLYELNELNKITKEIFLINKLIKILVNRRHFREEANKDSID